MEWERKCSGSEWHWQTQGTHTTCYVCRNYTQVIADCFKETPFPRATWRWHLKRRRLGARDQESCCWDAGELWWPQPGGVSSHEENVASINTNNNLYCYLKSLLFDNIWKEWFYINNNNLNPFKFLSYCYLITIFVICYCKWKSVTINRGDEGEEEVLRVTSKFLVWCYQ